MHEQCSCHSRVKVYDRIAVHMRAPHGRSSVQARETKHSSELVHLLLWLAMCWSSSMRWRRKNEAIYMSEGYSSSVKVSYVQ